MSPVRMVQMMTRQRRTRQDGFAVGLGVFLTTVGVRGLSRERVLGLEGMNRLHAVEHIAVGIAGVLAGLRRRGRLYAIVVGVVLLAEVVLGLHPRTRERFRTLFSTDRKTSAVQLLVALVSFRAVLSEQD